MQMDRVTLPCAQIIITALHRELDTECDLQATSVGRYLKHIATQKLSVVNTYVHVQATTICSICC